MRDLSKPQDFYNQKIRNLNYKLEYMVKLRRCCYIKCWDAKAKAMYKFYSLISDTTLFHEYITRPFKNFFQAKGKTVTRSEEF